MFKPIKYRQHNGYDTEEASDEARIPFAQHGESMTVQSMAEDADINVMMRRFGITGQFPETARVPSFGDFTGISDYRGALHAVMEAQDRFMELPAQVRMQFDNDPQMLLEFASIPENIPALIKMGLGKEQIANVSRGNNSDVGGTGTPTSGGTGTVQSTAGGSTGGA